MKAMTKWMLELFKGTGSVGRVFEANGYTVVSMDSDPKWYPTFCVNVLRWDYKRDLVPGMYDFLWASPPCTEYSTALTTRKRNIRLAFQTSLHTDRKKRAG